MNFYYEFFLVIFTVLAICEALFPRPGGDGVSGKFSTRWLINLCFFLGGNVLNRATVALIALWVSLESTNSLLSITKLTLFLPSWLQVVLGVLVLDASQYALHRLQHSSAFLWRFHKVHHAQREVDITSSWVFHPVEMVFDTIFISMIVYIFGVPPMAVLVSAMIVPIVTMVGHGNFSLPLRIDRILSMVSITPRMHLLHHSESVAESDTNYGVVFSFWDRLFGSFGYPDNASGMPKALGVDGVDKGISYRPLKMLLLPFK